MGSGFLVVTFGPNQPKHRAKRYAKAWSASGKAKEGILCIENGIQDYLALGSRLAMPYWLGLKAEALYLAHRTSEALESIEEAIVAERSGLRDWSAELRRLRGVFLAAVGAEERQNRAF